MPTKTTYRHTLPDGTVATRTSAKPYTHVVIGRSDTDGAWFVFRWSQSHANAMKARGSVANALWITDVRVEPLVSAAEWAQAVEQ